MDLNTVIASAAVGALVATLGQLIGQALERRARDRELIFRFSVEAARAARATALQAAQESGRILQAPDELYLAADYYPLVERLLHRGRHPREVKPEQRYE
jgi:hypothetical protein